MGVYMSSNSDSYLTYATPGLYAMSWCIRPGYDGTALYISK